MKTIEHKLFDTKLISAVIIIFNLNESVFLKIEATATKIKLASTGVVPIVFIMNRNLFKSGKCRRSAVDKSYKKHNV